MPSTYVVRVFETGTGELIDTLDFDSRESLAIFFANGAKLTADRYYQVTATS